MRSAHHDEGGSMALLVLLLLPMLLTVLVGALELGAVRTVAERVRLAADLAAVTAVNDQDDAELARTGSLRLAISAERVAREHFALNLAASGAALAATPDAIASMADVVALPTGGVDPRTGRSHVGPTVRIAAAVPIGTPFFAALLGRPVTTVQIMATSSAR